MPRNIILFFIFGVLARVAIAASAIPYHEDAALAKKCEFVDLPKFTEFDVINVHNLAVFNYSVITTQTPMNINFCHVKVTLTHPGANDVVSVSIWLPFNGWNGRFQATGGGGLSAGFFDYALGEPVANGFTAGSTDAGLTLNGTISAATGLWVLTSENKLNHELVKNFAYRSIHDMTVIGKAATKSFYGKNPHHSYYTGCSTGGRQGYFAVQHYPEDFDGVMANAPAIFTPRVSPGDFWPYLVMGNIVAPPQCVFTAFQVATIEACDSQDGAVDGLISAPEECHFDPKTLVAQKVNCTETGGSVVITDEHATVVAKILQGARTSSGGFLWYGNPPGAPFDGLANTTVIHGRTERVPFDSGEAWMRYFVAQDPNFDTANMTYDTFESLFSKSVNVYTDILGTDNPDLTAFKKAGGKLLTWHGLADPYITHPGTTRYWDKLQKRMGGPEVVDDFYRVFLAPGVAHCGGGYGPVPVDPLTALVSWAERGNAPKTLFASGDRNGVEITRQLCPYPRYLKYNGYGDLSDSKSFYCSSSA